MYELFDEYAIGRWWRDLYKQSSMYEIGKYFLQHKFVVKKCKHKRGVKNV